MNPFATYRCPKCHHGHTLELSTDMVKRPVPGSFPATFARGPLLACTSCKWSAVGVESRDPEGRLAYTFDFQPRGTS